MPTEFQKASEVRKFLKGKGFPNIKVRHTNNPFGGRDLFFVGLTDIPAGTTLVYSGGSNSPSKTFGDNAEVVKRIANMRELLADTNARVDH